MVGSQLHIDRHFQISAFAVQFLMSSSKLRVELEKQLAQADDSSFSMWGTKQYIH